MDHTEYNLNTVDFNYFLAELRKGKIMNETSFYFVDEISEPEHYIGCLPTIYRGKSLKERWDDVRIICMGGIPVDDYMKLSD